jgi:hypothetical protein
MQKWTTAWLRRAVFMGAMLPALLLTVARVWAKDPAVEFDAANQLYEQGRFREAAAAYEKLLPAAPTPALWFNLGNARFKAGQLGEAIAAYRVAQALAPRDPDIRANLQFARDQVKGPSLRPGWLDRRLASLTLNEWTLLAAVPAWLFLSLLTLRQLRPAPAPRLRGWTWFLGLSAVLGVGMLALVVLRAPGRDWRVVVAREAVVRHGPFEESPSAFTVNDGAELRELDRKDDWVRVTDGQRSGWVRGEQLAR